FFTHPPPPQLYTLSLHDALPIWSTADTLPSAMPHDRTRRRLILTAGAWPFVPGAHSATTDWPAVQRAARGQTVHFNAWAGSERIDRKSTRLNSSHLGISYAVFCL